MHLVPGRRAAQVGQAGATDQHVRWVRVIQRWQDAQLRPQLGVVMADAQPEAAHLLLKIDPRLDGRQRQVAHRAGVLDFTDQSFLDHAYAAFAVTQFELNQTHEFSPLSKTLQIQLWERACSRRGRHIQRHR
ncbi:hypothetical protein D9M71_632010 [compost metagenome]